jgi:tRNA(adenine34) deaminase
MILDHTHNMRLALDEARIGAEMNEVPVGALVVSPQGEVIAKAHNETIERCDPSAHAEVLALRRAAASTRNYRLLGCCLYVTVEPCVMCMGMIIHARISRVVFGAPDPKWGALGSLYNFSKDVRFNHRPDVVAGIYADQCSRLMRDFFVCRRASGFNGGVDGQGDDCNTNTAKE